MRMQCASGCTYMGGTIFPEHGLERPDVISDTDREDWDLRISIWIFLNYYILLTCLELIQERMLGI